MEIYLDNYIIIGGEKMEQEFIRLVLGQGIFACLFVWLFWDTRKDSKQREVKYQETISMLGDKLSVVDDIKDDITGIKNKLELF